LRTGKLNASELTPQGLESLKSDFEFFKIPFPIKVEASFGGTLLSPQQEAVIRQWFPKQTFTLLYKSTRDGALPAAFHQKCDNKGPTLVLIQSQQGYLFGGYTPVAWDSTSSYKASTTSFLFTLTNPNSIPPTKYAINPAQAAYAMFASASYCATFGSGHDLTVRDSNGSIYTNFPHTYIDTTGHGQNTFIGARNFVPTEVEVFSITQQ